MTLLDIQAIQEKVVYVCVQAVVARCVKHARDWTGFKIGPSDWGRTLRFTRPPGCGDSMPEVVVVKPKPPPGFRHQPLEEVIKFFQDLIAAVEKKTAAMHGARVLGVTYCESISPFSCPNTPAPMRTLNPRFSGRNKVHVAKALEHQRQFRHEHRIARAFFRKEQRDVVFPYGTIQMAAISGVCCAAPLLDDPHLARLQWSEITQKQWDDWKASQLRVA